MTELAEKLKSERTLIKGVLRVAKEQAKIISKQEMDKIKSEA
jgi:hypothetical protein